MHEGKEKLMALGKYSDVCLETAREQYAVTRKLLATGTDPMAQRKAGKRAERTAYESSFASMAVKWLEHWQDGKSLRHVDSTRRRITANLLPSLGERPVIEIEAPEIVAMVRLIDSREARDIAEHALETTGQIFRYAVAHSVTKCTPATEIRPCDILKVDYARIDAKELRSCFEKSLAHAKGSPPEQWHSHRFKILWPHAQHLGLDSLSLRLSLDLRAVCPDISIQQSVRGVGRRGYTRQRRQSLLQIGMQILQAVLLVSDKRRINPQHQDVSDVEPWILAY